MRKKRQATRLPQQHWIITGYESTRKIYERKVKAGFFNEQQIQSLLMALCATDLTFDEILGAYAKRKTKLSNHLLEVHRETSRYMFWCGQNRYFTAEIAEHKGKPWPPKLPSSQRVGLIR
jgi:hypothetical protein